MRPALVVLLAALVGHARGDVLVVAPTSAPAVDFTGVQPAVAAAKDGDLILVRAGTYAPFTIAGKALVVTAEHGASVKIQGGIGVRALGAAQEVALRGLATGVAQAEGFAAKNDLGRV